MAFDGCSIKPYLAGSNDVLALSVVTGRGIVRVRAEKTCLETTRRTPFNAIQLQMSNRPDVEAMIPCA
jgi:hypothetical protein